MVKVSDKEDAAYYKSKHIIESNSKNSSHMDSLALKTIPEEHIKRYEEEENVKLNEEKRSNLKIAFDEIKDILSYYMDMPEDKKTIIALWIIGTYKHNEFEAYPYLFLNAMRGSGKTRALKLITSMAKDGQMMMSMTEAGLFRTTGTLGIDEFESLGNKEKQPLRELLNASYKKGTSIVRMKKKKSLAGEETVAEYFEPYRPIVMANIWGIEEVLGDRSISLILEKSNNPTYTKLIENFSNNSAILHIKKLLSDSLVNIVYEHTEKKDIHTLDKWNYFVKTLCSLHTLYTLNTLNTQHTLTQEEEEMFNMINETQINGRNLELYMPLFLIAKELSDEVFNEVLFIAKENINLKKLDDIIESKDITVYTLVAGLDNNKYHSVKSLTDTMLLMVGDNMESRSWLNPKWMGSALKRLNLVIDKRRLGNGIEVTLNIQKALEKLEMFK